MRRALMLAVSALVLMGAAPTFGQAPNRRPDTAIPLFSSSPITQPKPGFVIDFEYSPKVGDEAILYRSGFIVAKGPEFVLCGSTNADLLKGQELYGKLEEKEEKELMQLAEEGRICVFHALTPVQILKVEPKKKEDGFSLFNAFVSFRVVSGKDKGEEAIAYDTDVRRLIPVSQLPSDPKALSLLRSAQNLEKIGKTQGAVEFYQKVVRQSPDSREMWTAIDRLKALGAKVPSAFDFVPDSDTDAPPTPRSSGTSRPKKRRYASQEAARQQLDAVLGQGLRNAIEADAAATQRRNEAMTPRNPSAGSHYCGAPTLDGTPCRRLVAGAFGYCYQHRGY